MKVKVGKERLVPVTTQKRTTKTTKRTVTTTTTIRKRKRKTKKSCLSRIIRKNEPSVYLNAEKDKKALYQQYLQNCFTSMSEEEVKTEDEEADRKFDGGMSKSKDSIEYLLLFVVVIDTFILNHGTTMEVFHLIT